MASTTDINDLRRLTDTPSADEPYTDPYLSALIDASGSVDGAAAVVWRQKAAGYADVVDMTESGSTRKLSDLHKNALAMAATFEERIHATLGGSSGVVQIERP